jgi:hypothetical protein
VGTTENSQLNTETLVDVLVLLALVDAANSKAESHKYDLPSTGGLWIGLLVFATCVAFWTVVACALANPKTETVTLTLTAASVLVVVLICGTSLCRGLITEKTEREIRRMEAFADALRVGGKAASVDTSKSKGRAEPSEREIRWMEAFADVLRASAAGAKAASADTLRPQGAAEPEVESEPPESGRRGSLLLSESDCR